MFLKCWGKCRKNVLSLQSRCAERACRDISQEVGKYFADTGILRRFVQDSNDCCPLRKGMALEKGRIRRAFPDGGVLLFCARRMM